MVLVRTILVIQGIYINWREPAFSSVVCKQKVCLTIKRRMAKEMQVVGGPSSTDEGMNKINIRWKSRENCSLQFWPAKLYQRGKISYTQYMEGSDLTNTIFDLTRNTGFEISKWHFGECWRQNCCEWANRQEDDICGLDQTKLSLKDKMKSVYWGTSLQ